MELYNYVHCPYLQLTTLYWRDVLTRSEEGRGKTRLRREKNRIKAKSHQVAGEQLVEEQETEGPYYHEQVKWGVEESKS